MIRVLIISHYPVIRYGLRQLLNETNDIQVVGEIADREEAIHTICTKEYNVLLLEVMSYDSTALELISELQHLQPSLAILIMGLSTKPEFCIRALRAGVSGYMPMDAIMDEFVRAIRIVDSGGKYVNNELAEALILSIQDQANQLQHSTLSDREYQVMCLIGEGNTPTEIAQILGLGTTTIATYRTRILKKLRLKSSAEIVRYVIEHRLLGL